MVSLKTQLLSGANKAPCPNCSKLSLDAISNKSLLFLGCYICRFKLRYSITEDGYILPLREQKPIKVPKKNTQSYRILEVLYNNPDLSSKELSEIIGSTKGKTTSLVSVLYFLGYVEPTKNTTRRKYKWQLTELYKRKHK